MFPCRKCCLLKSWYAILIHHFETKVDTLKAEMLAHEIFFHSLQKNYGDVFSVKLGSFRIVFACSTEAIKEALVKRSADYAGRPQFHSTIVQTLGKCLHLFTWRATCGSRPSQKKGFVIFLIWSQIVHKYCCIQCMRKGRGGIRGFQSQFVF
jgi:hypothetical protein